MIQANREAQIGVTALDQAYREYFPPGVAGRDRENGWAPGVAASARWMGDVAGLKTVYVAASVTYNGGQQDYHGSVFATDTPLDFRSGLANTLVQAELGKGFMLSPRLVITPAAAFGWSLWRRDLGPSQIEDYEGFTAGAMMHADYAATQRLVLRAAAGVAEEIAPRITFNYAHGYTTDLAARAAYQASLGADYALTRRLHLSADAAWSTFSYGRSAVVQTLERGRIFEPASTTTDARLQAALAYAF